MGRPQFEQIVAQAPRLTAVHGYIDHADPVLAGGSITFEITPSAGTVAKGANLRVNIDAAPAGASAGTYQSITVYVGGISIAYAKWDHTGVCRIAYSDWGDQAKITESYPLKSTAGLAVALGNLQFDASNPLKVLYSNGTDADHAAHIYVESFHFEEGIAS